MHEIQVLSVEFKLKVMKSATYIGVYAYNKSRCLSSKCVIYPRNMIYHYQTSSIACDLLLISFVYSVNHLFNHLLIIKIILNNFILFYDLYTVRISF